MRARVCTMERQLTAWSHVRAVLALPFMNSVAIPTTLLVLFRDGRIFSSGPAVEAAVVAISLPFLAAGITLVVRAITLFVRLGRGTLAPWNPTEVLITGDIYRFSRNTMKAGLFLVLIGETLLLRSMAVSVWAATFIVVNVLYIRWSEEPGLQARFGDEYTAYARAVPRWLRFLPQRQTVARGVGQTS